MDNAISLAQAVNCSSGVEGKGCGTCLSCRKISHGNHPDVIITDPVGSSFKIEQGREIQKKVSFRHYEGKYKVMILTGADVMTIAAANSMLKILEEPPERTIFILTAENGDNILPTVLSRCQVIKFGGEDASGDFARKIEDNEAKVQQVIDLVADLPKMNYGRLLKISESWEKDREGAKLLLENMLTWFRDIAVAKFTGKVEMVHHKSHWNMLMTNSILPDAALMAAQEVERSQRLIRQNANLKLVLDVMLLKLHRYLRIGGV